MDLGMLQLMLTVILGLGVGAIGQWVAENR